MNTTSCAYFYCEELFFTNEFIEEEKDLTVICPKYRINSAIDDIFLINDPIFLVEMSKYFFSYCIYLMFINIFYQIDLLSQQPLFHHHFH